MVKVKIFKDSIESQEAMTKLENQVNEWLALNPNIEIMDIKYSDAVWKTAQKSHVHATLLVIYK